MAAARSSASVIRSKPQAARICAVLSEALSPIDMPPQAVTGQVCSPMCSGNVGQPKTPGRHLVADVADVGRGAGRDVVEEGQRLGREAVLGHAHRLWHALANACSSSLQSVGTASIWR